MSFVIRSLSIFMLTWFTTTLADSGQTSSSTVSEIINNVKENRDKAVFEYTKKFDKADVDASNIRVTEEEIKEAYELVDEKLLAVIKKALVNIRKYHEKQLQNSWFTTEDGIILGQKVTPIAKAGVYVPGGYSGLCGGPGIAAPEY